MAEQWWISAASALKLAGSPIALCTRAHAGLVRAHASRLILDGNPSEDADVPAGFWWAGGHEALEQDWRTGDFSTWIKRTNHVQAFGVSFAAFDVLDMLPEERRGVASLSLSARGDPGWVTALEAMRQVLGAAAFQTVKAATTAIREQARLGFVGARAVEMTSEGGDSWREWDAPRAFWSRDDGFEDWTLGTFSGRSGDKTIWLTGLHFNREALSIAFSFGELPATEPPATTAKNTGGRPSAPFQDDLMCAVWALIYQGDFKPSKQADVQRALQDWASSQGHELGDTSAKEKARKIWAALNNEVKNPTA